MKLRPRDEQNHSGILHKLRCDMLLDENNQPSPESAAALASLEAQRNAELLETQLPATDLMSEIEMDVPHWAMAAREIAAQAGRLGL